MLRNAIQKEGGFLLVALQFFLKKNLNSIFSEYSVKTVLDGRASGNKLNFWARATKKLNGWAD